MKYIKSKDIDMDKSCFHFSRIANRNSIEKDGLKSIGDGENGVGNDKEHNTIFFSYGKEGVLEALNSWIRWEYNREIKKRKDYLEMLPSKGVNTEIMNKIHQKIYDDFKDRMYYKVDIEEGKDFSFDQVDYKKKDNLEYIEERYNNAKTDEERKRMTYPNPVIQWMYGSYSDFENKNVKVDKWNMFTKEDITINPEKLSILETEDGRSDALSFAMETYDNCKDEMKDKNIDLDTLDGFMDYAKERYKTDKDFEQGAPDIGRREISKEEEEKSKERSGLKVDEVKESSSCREGQMKDASEYIEKSMNKEKEEQNKEINSMEEGMM